MLHMAPNADVGKGYVAATSNRSADATIGLVPGDALDSRVKQVAFGMGNARVGQMLDYNKLSLARQTDGAITRDYVAAYAMQSVPEQFADFT